MIYSLAIVFLGTLCLSFIFWRRLKEDYINSQIFTSILIVSIVTAVFFILGSKYLGKFSFWISFIGYVLGITISSYKFRLRFYETFESAIIAVFPLLSGVYLLDVVNHSSIFSLGAFVVTFAFQFLYLFINNRYKNFGWYKSGRIGFAGLTTLGIYFIVRGVVAIVFPFMLSFSGSYETIISGVVSFLLFLAVFDLSRK
jgi:hypothetical protein